jgi:hypothetical protein
MKISVLMAAVLAMASLTACEKKTIVNPPPAAEQPAAVQKEVVPVPVPVQGPQGPAGEKGEKGDPGTQGPQGETGEKGDPGKNGSTTVVVPQQPAERR